MIQYNLTFVYDTFIIMMSVLADDQDEAVTFALNGLRNDLGVAVNSYIDIIVEEVE